MRVKATVLCLIGAYLLPDSSGDCVNLIYLSLVEDIDAIKGYAWGATLHAELHCSLGDEKKNFKGSSLVLRVFLLMHIPSLASLLKYALGPREPAFPLLKGWMTSLSKTSKNSHRDVTEADIEEFFKGLRRDSITWKPYEELDGLPDDRFPSKYRHQRVYGLAHIFSFNMWKRVTNVPYLANRQFSIPAAIVDSLRTKYGVEDRRHLCVLQKQPTSDTPRDYDQLWSDAIEERKNAIEEIALENEPIHVDPLSVDYSEISRENDEISNDILGDIEQSPQQSRESSPQLNDIRNPEDIGQSSTISEAANIGISIEISEAQDRTSSLPTKENETHAAKTVITYKRKKNMPQIREENLEEGHVASEAASQIPEENLEEGHVANTLPANQDKETPAGIELPSEAAFLSLRRMLGGTPATIIPHRRTHKPPKFFTPSEYDQPKR